MRTGWKVAIGSTVLVGLLSLTALAKSRSDSQLSAAVAIVSQGPDIEEFLTKPSVSAMQAYIRFGDKRADDVVMGIDQELIDGVRNPYYVKNGDWMAFVGVQRSGIVFVGGGSDETMKGKPGKDRQWKIYDLKQRLQANTWYLVRTEADFSTRHFKCFSIRGPGIDQTLDIHNVKVDYPNAIPFSGRAMTYYVSAMRGKSMMKEVGDPLVYFDDAEGSVLGADGKFHSVFKDGFESQQAVGPQPITFPKIDLDAYRQRSWYLERKEAKIRIAKVPFAHGGQFVCVADAGLN